MKIGICGDHAAVEYKSVIIEQLKELGHEVVNFGTDSTDSVDYPDYAQRMCADIVEGKLDEGIAICGTGIGMSMACNKVKGIRAALCHDTFSARATKNHNDANVLCLGARTTGLEIAKDIVANFLEAKFEGGRHVNRVNKLEC